ncbi:MAG: hypothetical protein WDW38_002120 [Sanguina aurantia]
MDVSELELQGLYTWVDEIPLSRPKRNIARDFSDGVLMAEIVQHYFPKLVELHNYSSANGLAQKMYNWNTLNSKVFKRLSFVVVKPDVESVCNCQAGAVERVLKLIKVKITAGLESGADMESVGISPSMTQTGAPATMSSASPRGMQSNGGQAPMDQSYLTGGNSINGVASHSLTSGTVALAEKEQNISELRETNSILETKVRKLEQLVRLKDAKIQTLMAKLSAAGLS